MEIHALDFLFLHIQNQDFIINKMSKKTERRVGKIDKDLLVIGTAFKEIR